VAFANLAQHARGQRRGHRVAVRGVVERDDPDMAAQFEPHRHRPRAAQVTG
jgi:hypothetical protein